MTDHLTDAGTDLGRLASKTPAGMAYFTETGPPETTCETCRFFRGAIRREGIGKGQMQPGRCAEFIRMMKSKGYRTAPVFEVPPDTPSCRHYAKREPKAPPKVHNT